LGDKLDTVKIIKRAAEKGAFTRVRYEERKVPTSAGQIAIMCLFPDLKDTFVDSALLLKRYREEVKGSKYFILISWPGFDGLFPYVDEYWTIEDEAALFRLKDGVKGFRNTSEAYTLSQRHLNHFFEDNIDSDILTTYYSRGLTEKFFERFANIHYFRPTISSSVAIGPEFNRAINSKTGIKVFVYPERSLKTWRYNVEERLTIPKNFWVELCKQLVGGGFLPVIYRDTFSYDISADLTDECIHLKQQPISKLLGAMRATGCVLDLFSGISRIAIAARCPYLLMDERARYMALKEYEIDDLCAGGLPRDYIFSFSTIIRSGDPNLWKINIFDLTLNRLRALAGKIDMNNLPPTSESNEVVTYEQVRKRKVKRLGPRFIKMNRD
jgi:hypothetical protein